MHSIINSKFLKWKNEASYYEDMSKFAKLGLWIVQLVGGDKESVEELIGEYPTLEEDRVLNEEDLEIIEMCKANNLKYKITNKGIKISA